MVYCEQKVGGHSDSIYGGAEFCYFFLNRRNK